VRQQLWDLRITNNNLGVKRNLRILRFSETLGILTKRENVLVINYMFN